MCVLKFGYANSTTANNGPNHMLESKHVQKSFQGHDPVLYCSSSEEANLLDLASQNPLVIESSKMHSSPLRAGVYMPPPSPFDGC